MRRPLPALAFVLLCSPPAAALVGNATALSAHRNVGRHIVMIVSTRGNLCTGTALARDLVLHGRALRRAGRDLSGVPAGHHAAGAAAQKRRRASALQSEGPCVGPRHRRCRAAQDRRRVAGRDCLPRSRHRPRSRPATASSSRAMAAPQPAATPAQARRAPQVLVADRQARHAADSPGSIRIRAASARALAPAPATPAGPRLSATAATIR